VKRGKLVAVRSQMERAMGHQEGFAQWCVSIEADDAERVTLEDVIERVRTASIVDDDVLEGDKGSRDAFSVDAFREAQALRRQKAAEASAAEAVKPAVARGNAEHESMTVEEAVDLVHAADGVLNWVLFAPSDGWMQNKTNANVLGAKAMAPQAAEGTARSRAGSGSGTPLGAAVAPAGGYAAAMPMGKKKSNRNPLAKMLAAVPIPAGGYAGARKHSGDASPSPAAAAHTQPATTAAVSSQAREEAPTPAVPWTPEDPERASSDSSSSTDEEMPVLEASQWEDGQPASHLSAIRESDFASSVGLSTSESFVGTAGISCDSPSSAERSLPGVDSESLPPARQLCSINEIRKAAALVMAEEADANSEVIAALPRALCDPRAAAAAAAEVPKDAVAAMVESRLRYRVLAPLGMQVRGGIELDSHKVGVLPQGCVFEVLGRGAVGCPRDSEREALCPKGHTLSWRTTTDDKWSCDVCRTFWPKSARVLDCRKCDWCCCDTCTTRDVPRLETLDGWVSECCSITDELLCERWAPLAGRNSMPGGAIWAPAQLTELQPVPLEEDPLLFTAGIDRRSLPGAAQ